MSKPNVVPFEPDVCPSFVKGISAAYNAAEVVDQVELMFVFENRAKRRFVCRVEIFEPGSMLDDD